MIQEFKYENNEPALAKPGFQNISYDDTLETMINTSAMAKSFGKTPAAWLRLSSTKRFLYELSEMKNIPLDSLVKKEKRNGESGVYMHEEAALEFARWLSPSFAIWNNQRTRELLLTGKTERQLTDELLPSVASDLLLKGVEWVEDEVQRQIRKAEYHDAVLQSKTLISTTLIAKELGMSAIALNKLLYDKKIIYKTSTHWLLYADYQSKGFTGTKTALYLDSSGRYQSNIHTYWTEKGREFIHSLLRETKQIA